MTALDEKPQKLCPKCGRAMWVVDVEDMGRLWLCASCKLSMAGGTLYMWREQEAASTTTVEVRTSPTKKYISNKPCPQCGEPMVAVQVPDYGTRHQCETCRLSVMFGGSVVRWKTRDRAPES